MGIPIREIVDTPARFISAGQTGLELNGLFLSDNANIPTGTVLEFISADNVGAYFGLTSMEYESAARYFLGYTNSTRKPSRLYMARYLAAAAAPFLRGGPVQITVGNLALIDSATMTLTIGTYEGAITADFTGVASYSDAATIIQTAIRTISGGGEAWTLATVTYSSQFNAFTITAGAAGAENGISYGAGSLADTLLFKASDGAVISQGSDALTLDENMYNIVTLNDNWVTFTPLFAVGDEQRLEFAAWSSAQGVRYLYVLYDDQDSLTVLNNTGTYAQTLIDNAGNGTAAIYGAGDNPAQYAAFLMGAIASIDYNRQQGVITTAFKQSPGLPVTVNDSNTALALRQKGFNYYGDYAENNARFTFFYPGTVYGQYRYIDPYINQIWLCARLQVAFMNAFTNISRIPYTDQGYGLLRSAAIDPINAALLNGVIEPGVTLTELQRAQIIQEVGSDVTDQINTEGYYLDIRDPGAQVRAERGSPIAYLYYTYGGAVQRLTIPVTAVE